MTLSNVERKKLHQAFLSAFVDEVMLSQMVDFELDENLESIAGKGKLSNVVFNLIRWAESQGRTEELIKGAIAQNPGNPPLQDFAQQFLTSDNPNSTTTSATASQDSLTDAQARIKLSRLLASLPTPQFDQILFALRALKLPQGNVPPISAAQANRVSALLDWADSPIGCGLDQLQAVLQSVIDFNH